MNEPKVRVRFAPSPTGELHVGGARTALYNYLFAKANGGDFIIRIEDTDRERLVEGSLDRILEGLKWLGLAWDEGPDIGGPHAPYVQSQRLARYQAVAAELVGKGAAYYCFCTAQRLEVLRVVQQSQKQPTRYDRECLKLSASAVQDKLAKKDPYIIRLKVPAGETAFMDIIRGQVTVQNNAIDDQVLTKSDGFPTYHLANIVDDHDMKITHVIRGEEWLPSTPKHVILYQALGWQAPAWAHLPNVLNEKRAKLSKRKDGAAVWVETYRAQGYLATALVNFLALLGWHPQGERELFTLAELVNEFKLERAQKAGAILSLEKLKWFNASYLKNLPSNDLQALLQPYYESLSKKLGRTPHRTNDLTEILRSRLATLEDIEREASWFFRSTTELSADLLIPKGGNAARALTALTESAASLARVGDWTLSEVQRALEVIIRPGTFTRQEVLWPVRTALTGERQSPDVFAVAWALGRDDTLARLARAIEELPT